MTTYHPVQSIATVRLLDQFNTTRHKLLLILAATVLVVLYVYQTSALATRTFVIHDLEQELRALETVGQEIEVQIAEERSLARVEERLVGKSFVQTDAVSYVSARGTTVVRR